MTTSPQVRHGWRSQALVVGIVAVVVTTVYWPVLAAQALSFDDASYLGDNPLVRNPSWSSAGRFLTEVLQPSTVAGYYHPLAMISLMLDAASGADTDNLSPVRRTSLALHVGNAALLALLVYQLFHRPWAAALVGVLFGVHPVTVESVAWLAERKTVLATAFGLLALLGYVSFARTGRRWQFGGALMCFLLALLSKPTTAPLPILLLLLDVWPLRRLSRRAVWEKAPFLLLAGASAVVTIMSQARTASADLPHHDLLARLLLLPCYANVFGLRAWLWPAGLTFYYPLPDTLRLSSPSLLVGLGGTLMLLVVLAVSLRWTRAAAVGWGLFFTTLLPSSGVVGFTDTLVALRHAYLPGVGLLLLAAAGCARAEASRRWRWGLAVGGLLLAALASRETRQLLGPWQTTESLYSHMLRLAPDAPVLHNNLGRALIDQLRYAEAADHLSRAVALGWPHAHMSHFNYGAALEGLGRVADARAQFALASARLEAVLRDKPGTPELTHALAQALARQGRPADAQPYLERAVAACPQSADLWMDLGNVLALRGERRRATECYQKALQRKPGFFAAYVNLGATYQELGDATQAAAAYRAALAIRPDAEVVRAQLMELERAARPRSEPRP